MSSYKNASKSRQKTHKERSQPQDRAHLGFLQKKKDYKARAEDYQKKQNTLKVLKRKALNRNPDEFYFNMVKTQKVDGVHKLKETTEPKFTETQLKMMESQDLRYVNFKRTTEHRKIEKLKSTLHLIDAEDKPKNKHTIFVDSEKEVKEFDPAKYFDTHPALLSRSYNRPTWKMLKEKEFFSQIDDDTVEQLGEERQKRYKELTKRIEREKQLKIIGEKMETKKHLMDRKAKKEKLADETKESAAQYVWAYKRKK
ncbi:probable U3 small nucleolar RNA-associated protein 11 [Gigantopelta aegis]|uniref:probable U3 small nucleolar RNA-associated protein 11 n=1 Tax=Gigantopelta aegis TaxID=1735272 RepID=UPI001B88B248|nr:probable U3 small nucleolar RNA-associated protein 11 [Gigantopelta aegis]